MPFRVEAPLGFGLRHRFENHWGGAAQIKGALLAEGHSHILTTGGEAGPKQIPFSCGSPALCNLWILYCHLKIFSATTKLISSHASNIATWIQLAQSDAPSFITARRSVLSAVSGNALMNG